MPKALVVGSVALDSVETPHGKTEEALGGSASYASVSASYFAQPELVGVVGKDFPRRHVNAFKKRGIGLDGLEIVEGQTFRWSGFYEHQMDAAQTYTTALNVFENFRPELTPAQQKIPFLFLANISPDLQLYVLDKLIDPKLVALDTMNYWIEGAKKELTKVIRRCSLLLLNEGEARQYCETTNLVEAGLALKKLGPQTVIIKKGEHGSLVFLDGQIFSVPGYPLRKLKDPTGAGDTYAGGLTGYLARLGKVTPENIVRAVVIGSVMASFDCEDFSLRRLLNIKAGEIRERAQTILAMSKLAEPSAASLKVRVPQLDGAKPRKKN